MSENVELNISETNIEQLRCTICKGYLSLPPLRILPDGNSICGRCTPSNTDVLTYRQLTLEALLGNAVFPCKYKQTGCTVRLSFGCTTDHEDKCTYRPTIPLKGNVKTQLDLESHDGENSVAKAHVQTEAMKSSTSVTSGDKPQCSTMDVDPPASTSRNTNAASPPSAPGSTRNLDWNSNRRASTGSNRSSNNWIPPYGMPPRIRGYDVHWNEHPPRNNWDRNGQFQGPRGRRNLFYHKRFNRNSVVIIKGGTFYINF